MIDAPGAFLTADMDEEVIVILENEIVDAMLEIDKDVYEKYVKHGNNDKKNIYVRLINTMYGMIKAELPYYRKISKELR